MSWKCPWKAFEVCCCCCHCCCCRSRLLLLSKSFVVVNTYLGLPFSCLRWLRLFSSVFSTDSLTFLIFSSVYKYYGAKHIPKLSEWWEQGVIRDLMDKKTIVRGVKKLSILLGSLAQGLIWADYVKLSDEAKRNLYGESLKRPAKKISTCLANT